jgi:hypothetical protein
LLAIRSMLKRGRANVAAHVPRIMKMHFAPAIPTPNGHDHLDTCGFWHVGVGRDAETNDE